MLKYGGTLVPSTSTLCRVELCHIWRGVQVLLPVEYWSQYVHGSLLAPGILIIKSAPVVLTC
jgi:hypothetical protein